VKEEKEGPHSGGQCDSRGKVEKEILAVTGGTFQKTGGCSVRSGVWGDHEKKFLGVEAYAHERVCPCRRELRGDW